MHRIEGLEKAFQITSPPSCPRSSRASTAYFLRHLSKQDVDGRDRHVGRNLFIAPLRPIRNVMGRACGKGVRRMAQCASLIAPYTDVMRVHGQPGDDRDHFSGSGMNSISSPGTLPKWPAAHSALACSMRSLREETKFHQICRGPSMAAPPRIIKCA